MSPRDLGPYLDLIETTTGYEARCVVCAYQSKPFDSKSKARAAARNHATGSMHRLEVRMADTDDRKAA